MAQAYRARAVSSPGGAGANGKGASYTEPAIARFLAPREVHGQQVELALQIG